MQSFIATCIVFNKTDAPVHENLIKNATIWCQTTKFSSISALISKHNLCHNALESAEKAFLWEALSLWSALSVFYLFSIGTSVFLYMKKSISNTPYKIFLNKMRLDFWEKLVPSNSTAHRPRYYRQMNDLDSQSLFNFSLLEHSNPSCF